MKLLSVSPLLHCQLTVSFFIFNLKIFIQSELLFLVAAEQKHEQKVNELTSQIETLTADLDKAKSDLSESESKYDLLKDKAQKKLHDLKKQLEEKTALLSTNEQV